MVFGFLFKKKKKDQPQTKSESSIKGPAPQNVTAQPSANQSQIQSKAPVQKPGPLVSNPPPKKGVDGDPDEWIYDYLLQYLTSPLWKIPIYTFIDENCIIFDTEEENPFIYTEIHNKFKKLIEENLEGVLKELEITEEQFVKQLERGVENEGDKKIFEQLLIVDNFLVFKKLMLKRNKELELEAMKMLEEQAIAQSKGATTNNTSNLKKMELEAEQAQIEHALAMSLAVEEERARMLAEEDELYQRALLESQMSYEEQQKRIEMLKSKELSDLEAAKKLALKEEADRKKKEESDKKQKDEAERKKKEEADKKQKEEADKKKKEEEEKKKKADAKPDSKPAKEKELEVKEGEKKKFEQEEEEESKVAEKKSSSTGSALFASRQNVGMAESVELEKNEVEDSTMKKSPAHAKKVVEGQSGPLMSDPPLKKQSTMGLPPLKAENKLDPMSLNELLDKRKELQAKIEGIKQEQDEKNLEQGESQESIMERKRRLQQQRDLILKKKKEERENELKKYKEEQEKQGGAKGMIGKKPSMEQSGGLFGMTVSTQDTEKMKKANIMKKIKEGLEDDL